MKKAFNIIGLALALLLAFSSCQKAPFLTFTGQKSFTFKDAGGSETITFSCDRAWTATSSESWLTVSPAKGDANEEGVRVTITCAANTTYDPRNATITISSEGLTETISVSQDTNYGLMSEPTTSNLTNEAQNIEVEVKANVEYTITIDESCKDWISQAGTKALSSTKLTFNIAANESYDDREGKITISEASLASSSVQPQVITVKQSQTNGLFITTPEYALSNESHDLTIEVKANVEFEVTSQTDWIKFVETKSLKASTISLTVDANESYDNRTGTVIVKQTNGDLTGTITVNQHQTDGLFVSPNEFDLDDSQQSVGIVVEQNVAYSVVIPDDAKTWIAIAGSSQTKALSKETVNLNIAKNTTYDDREAFVTIKQVDGAMAETVKIKQDHSYYKINNLIAGDLESSLTNINKEKIKGLIVEGLLNGTDILCIRKFNSLELLDLSNSRIIEGGDCYYGAYKTKNDCIGPYMFYLKKFNTFISPNSITTIEEHAFDDFDGEYIKLCDGIKEIADYAFHSCDKLLSINLPEGLTKIGERAFHYTLSLSEISIPNSVGEIGIDAFSWSGLKKANIPTNLKIIPQNMFEYCGSLVSIGEIGSNVVTIESGAFSSTSIKELIIPDNVEKCIGCFGIMRSLKKLVISKNVANLGGMPFMYNTNMKELFLRSPTVVYAGDFNLYNGIYHGCIIYVPRNIVNQYKADSFWVQYADEIVAYDFD